MNEGGLDELLPPIVAAHAHSRALIVRCSFILRPESLRDFLVHTTKYLLCDQHSSNNQKFVIVFGQAIIKDNHHQDVTDGNFGFTFEQLFFVPHPQ
ncbi:hypothetical protein JTB14_032086 [Gonioctena quinquepunctata]|nr:hypothetical protein JTB14_032086 [Gonioctena quinquepunctata]